MGEVEKILGVVRPIEHTFSILKQSPEAVEDFSVKKVVNTREGTVEKVPVNDSDIANKKYVDLHSGGAPEGTAVKSTGEAGGTKFLREDGDGTCSWQAAAGGGNVTAAANLTDVNLVQGDGGAKGVKATTITSANAADAVTKKHTQGTDQGVDTGGGNEVTAAHIKDAYTHSQNNSQAHSDYLLNSGADIGVGLQLTGDNESADTYYVPNILYNTDATPPAANTVPRGTLYIQYTP
jgi:hypothetical protein